MSQTADQRQTQDTDVTTQLLKAHKPTPSIAIDDAKHPLADTPMSGADVVVQVLADEGVDVMFGYSGGAILPVYDALYRYNA